MRHFAKWIGWGILGTIIMLLAVAVLTARPGDPALWPPRPGGAAAEVFVVSHGYHAGIVVRRGAAAELAGRQGNQALLFAMQRFATYQWLEIGWGDETFYRSVPDASSATFSQAARALFRPGNPSVVHIVGLKESPRVSFPNSEIVRIDLSANGFGHMLDRLDASIARAGENGTPEDLGAGLYGPSKFFRGVDSFHVFNLCNHWVARLLAAAGIPTAPVLATLPQGLFLDLKLRAGLLPMPTAPIAGRGG
jgi:uncharacterized protein (TIGR02117 family)